MNIQEEIERLQNLLPPPHFIRIDNVPMKIVGSRSIPGRSITPRPYRYAYAIPIIEVTDFEQLPAAPAATGSDSLADSDQTRNETASVGL